jgi:predicted dehydrogenase
MHSQCYTALEDAKVVALADPEPDRRELAASTLGCDTYQSLEELLAQANVDMVDVCTPTYLHEELTVTAAAAGKHVMCEKPLSLSVEACDRMIAACERADVSLMIGHVVRFSAQYQIITDLVKSGKYGRVEWISARRLSAAPKWSWQGWLPDPARSGGGILDLHIHDLDYIEYLLGLPGKVNACGTLGAGGAMDTALTSAWDFRDGARAYAEGCLSLPEGYPFTTGMIVACEQATIQVGNKMSPSPMIYPKDGEPFAPEVPAPKVTATVQAGGNISSLGGYFNELQYWVGCLKAGKKPEVVTPQSSRNSVRFSLAARESAETGKTVSL